MDDNSLLAQTLRTIKELYENGKQCWYTGLVFILDELNIVMSIGEIKSKLIKRSMEYWEKMLKENAVVKHGKLRTYFYFKPNFKKENYFHVIKNRDVRKCFTQFRISAHQLAIERGRYKNIKADERFCKYCQAIPEVHVKFPVTPSAVQSAVGRKSTYYMCNVNNKPHVILEQPNIELEYIYIEEY